MAVESSNSKGQPEMDTTNIQQLSSDESKGDRHPYLNGTSGLKSHIKACKKHPSKLADSNYSKELGACVPRHADWHYTRQLTKVLELFKRKTKKASATSKMGRTSLTLCFNICQDQKFNKLLYFATILDPRWKVGVIAFGYKEIFTAEKKENETVDGIIQKVSNLVKCILRELVILFEHYVRNNEEQSSSNVKQRNIEKYSEGDDEDNDFLSGFKSDCGVPVLDTKSELQRYLDDNEESDYRGFDILQWWKNSSSKFPILAKMAKDILAIQISSVASEAVFSMAGRVVETYRSSLSPAIVEALVCTRDWLCKSSKDINVEEDWAQFDEIGAQITENVEPNK
ncbi:hypothetical protein QVD17_11894 [Tagetes erecta]|uniref:HAT C-terminal dimerisation domain-containing protein n=1 Tax=Tagetes erecta TaxID=13708 RepID=A0AAD8P2F9_TARER|nr:hypothetical protein QVD17_11894 [Tagetes erecta]